MNEQMIRPEPPDRNAIEQMVALALQEDLGSGDLSAALIPATACSRVKLVCREPAVLCGKPWAEAVLHSLDADTAIQWHFDDGDDLPGGALVCELAGNTRALLSAERTVLNFLQTLSGTASLSRRYAEAVAGTGARVLDTRKTLPGLRLAQKYAVRCGGCHNHRLGLFDVLMLKENHILAAGSITAALQAARRQSSALQIEVEVETRDELAEALGAGAERILLDNFDLPALREAVAYTAGRARLEASGNVDLSRVRAIAETGVDDISVGALTKDVKAVDLSMRFATAV